MKILQICPRHLSDVATLPWEIQKKSFSTVLFVHTSGYLCYVRRLHLIGEVDKSAKVSCQIF